MRSAIKAAGALGVTVTEVTEYNIDFVPKVKLEILVESSRVDEVMDLIAAAAKTDKIGDGKIWSIDLGSLMRVRTGERGDDAI